ncbi:hypothetical protein ERHA54_22820 [Erwinia rhapontici]|nr:hypothetical protein ERHA54_22820 [Erwinia rhapontici]
MAWPLLQQMLSDPYFALSAPKSTGREYFNLSWLEQQLSSFPGLPAQDVQATLVELTATTIAQQVLLSGGVTGCWSAAAGATIPC